MENSSNSMSNLSIKLPIVSLLIVMYYYEAAEGQITMPCSSSAISSFTPCMNYITGSSANGGSPSGDCCDAVRSIMSGSVECACLIVNGNVPFSIPFISQPLAISLPQACNSGIPLQCKATGVPLPAPGPIIFGSPPPPPHAATSPIGHKGPIIYGPPPVANSPTGQRGPIIFGPPPIANSPKRQKGPIIFGPTPAPAANSPSGQRESKAAPAVAAPSPIQESTNQITPATSPAPSLAPTEAVPAMSPTEAPTAAVSPGPVANPAGTAPVTNPRIRPVVQTNTASNPSYVRPPILMLTLLGLMVLTSN